MNARTRVGVGSFLVLILVVGLIVIVGPRLERDPESSAAASVSAAPSASRVVSLTPPELVFRRAGRIDLSPTSIMDYSVDTGSNKLHLDYRTAPGQGQVFAAKTETVAHTILGAAPLWNRQLVVALYDTNGLSHFEKWTVGVLSSIGGATLTTVMSPLASNLAIPRMRVFAAPPSGSFVIGILHESSTLVRIDFPSGGMTTLATESEYPNLPMYRQLQYFDHATEGPVFVLDPEFCSITEHPDWWLAFLGAYPPTEPYQFSDDVWMLLWDQDVDGTPNSIEEMTSEEWESAGYGPHWPGPFWPLNAFQTF